MAYIDLDGLNARFGEQEILDRSNKDAPAATANADAVAKAIQDAQAVVDSYLGTKYAVPLADPVPELVEAATATIALYKLAEGAVTDEIRRNFEDAVAWLKDVAAGRAVVVISDPTADLEESRGRFAVFASPTVFTDDLGATMPGGTGGSGHGPCWRIN
jgi:phage gp36-like protein